MSIAGLHVGVTTWGAMPPQPTPAEGACALCRVLRFVTNTRRSARLPSCACVLLGLSASLTGFIYHEGKTSRDDFTFVVACLTSICSWKAVDYPQPNGKSLYCKFFRTPFRDDEASSIVNGAGSCPVGLIFRVLV